jgi:ArsR family transcriptional regulator, arsenate/arsenite/antimonite-responsive transcriptional repressor
MQNVDAISALGALAQADRLAALRLILRSGKDGLPSGQIASQLKVAPTRMSFHLTTLERAGLLCANRSGRHILYAVNFEAMRSLLGFLTDECCDGHPEICGNFLIADCKPELEEVN